MFHGGGGPLGGGGGGGGVLLLLLDDDDDDNDRIMSFPQKQEVGDGTTTRGLGYRGLFFSTIAQNQQQALQMSSFFILPNMLLSGFMFPFEGMPVPAQWVAQIFPLTHFIRIVRGITLKGASYPEVALEVYWLAAILVVVVVATAARFSKKLG